MPSKIDVPQEYWQRAEAVEALLKRKVCLAGTMGGCDGPIVGAHTIPRSQLQNIAVDGHINEFQYNADHLARSNGKVTVGKRGIGQFSVLNCFCTKHDAELFSHLEGDPLVFDQHQLLLLHYRALGGEVYRKDASVASFRVHLAEYEGKRGAEAESIRAGLGAAIASEEPGLRDLRLSFSAAGTAVAEGKHDDVSAAILKFQKPPTMMAVGAFAPFRDYAGTLLQAQDADTIAEHASISLLFADGGARVAVIWPKNSSPGKLFAETLAKERSEQLTTLVIQALVGYFENVCTNIPWWNGLLEAERRSIVDRMEEVRQPPDRVLKFGGIGYDNWGFTVAEFKNV
jgi:hypothetical protein